jgi:hypothetical protein
MALAVGCVAAYKLRVKPFSTAGSMPSSAVAHGSLARWLGHHLPRVLVEDCPRVRCGNHLDDDLACLQEDDDAAHLVDRFPGTRLKPANGPMVAIDAQAVGGRKVHYFN